MHLKRSFYVFFATLSLFTIVFTSCDDDPSQFGLDVLPSEDRINIKEYDSLTFSGEQTVFPNELLPYNDIVNIGLIQDSLLGEVKGSVFTQFYSLPISNEFDSTGLRQYTFEDSYVSLYIHFEPDTIFTGNSNASVVFDIFPLTSKLKGGTYYNNIFSPATYYDNTFSPASYYDKNSAPIASFEVDASKIKTGFDVSLSDEFAKQFFEYDSLQIDSINSLTNGICIVPRSYKNGGLIMRSDYSYSFGGTPSTYMKLQYHKTSSDTSEIRFGFTSNYPVSSSQTRFIIAKANIVEYDYSNGMISSANTGDSLLFVTNFGGQKIKYSFSKLYKFPRSSRTAIMKAELVIPMETSFYNSAYTNTSQLKALALLPDTNSYFTYSSFFTVVGTACVLSNNEYKIDLTDYVQKYVSGKTSIKELLLSIDSKFVLDHAILKKNKKAQLKIKYTNF